MTDLHERLFPNYAMTASQVAQRYGFSALLILGLSWLYAVRYKYVHTARMSRWKLCLLLISCALANVYDLHILVFSKVQLHRDGIIKVLDYVLLNTMDSHSRPVLGPTFVGLAR